ncbi:MAG: molybdenum cofactor guanylyltransferase [Hydrocarboniphaga sp.]|uniref:molybdenum cofactor guanylyltransferase MobA n=1 Tax=Hydrocarboniphaga sp. TaxID=2033016 RepID=UPI00260BED3D|nr:molybdenum cofactor guanylyltransferase MobA [Hydrocarboniphaga sp.]MDB5969769.1 molybdenum cofactor guanylyltransferase [Hydrocarboniphaga sp.]
MSHLSHSQQPIAGGILAGGEGRRFGGLDKGWIAYRGHSFVEQVLSRLQPQVDELLISANRNLDRYQALGHPVLSDRLGAGPLAGLLRLLESASRSWLLTAPCDALDLPTDLARQFIEIQRSQDADVVVLTDDDGVHPTVSLTRASLAPDIEAFMRDGGLSLQRWQSRHRVVQARRGGVLCNVNDATALDELQREPVHG